MNNKIKKSLSYFSLFILALSMLPLGNILADEKVEPTKFVIEQNNLEANGFKIANDQVLMSEDVVKLSNVKSVDNLVDVNSLTVSEDQLANVNQSNPEGGLYNLTLSNEQQANITVPVVKEGSLTTTNSKGALIFKNLALSQEANTKEKVLEETGVYSVAFNNGYVNSDLTVDINDNNTVLKDTNLGLTKELMKDREELPYVNIGQGIEKTLPHSMESIISDGENGNIQAAIEKGKANLKATMESAKTIQVHNEQEFVEAFASGKNQNIVIDVVKSFDGTTFHEIINQDGSTYTITSSNGSEIRLVADSPYEFIAVKSSNLTVNFANITFKGMISAGEAIQIGMDNPDLPGQKRRSLDIICDISGNSQTNLTINTYPGFVVKDIYEGGDEWSGAFLSIWSGKKTILNMYGGEFSNINGQNIVSVNYRDDRVSEAHYLLNVYDVDVHDTYTRVGGIFGQEDNLDRNVSANFFGGHVYNNVNGSSDSRGAIASNSQLSGNTTRIGADFKVYDNYVVDPNTGTKLQQANISVTARDYNKQLDLANAQVLLNPQPSTKIHLGNDGIGQCEERNIDNVWDSAVINAPYFSQFHGLPLAKIQYTDKALEAMYKGNGVVEGVHSDWKEGSPSSINSRTITQSGNYYIVEKVVNGQSYAVLVKDYIDLNVTGKLDGPNGRVLYGPETHTIPISATSKIIAKPQEGYIIKGANITYVDGFADNIPCKKVVEGNNTFFEVVSNQVSGKHTLSMEILYEKEQTNYTVHFDGNGSTRGEMADQSLPTGVATPLTNNAFRKDGCVFAGWTTQQDGAGDKYTDGQPVTDLTTTGQSITLYAQWTPIAYIVRFVGGGDAIGSMNDLTLTYDKAQALTANAFIKPGYTFKNWSGDNGQTYTDGQEVKNLTTEANKVITLTAQWTANAYTINFNGNKGNASTDVTGTTTAINKTFGQDIALPANGFNHEGYTFKEWNTKADGQGTGYTTGSQLSQDLTDTTTAQTLYAIWTPITYKVHFEGNGGKVAMADQDMTFDQDATLSPNTFVNAGKEFAGWSKKQAGPVEYQDQASVKNLANTQTATVILYAQWQDNQSYTITYDANQGSGKTEAQTQPLGTPIQLQQNGFTREGYTFKEWNTKADGQGTSYQPGQAITNEFSANTTLYAIWEGKSVTISFNGNGGQGNMNNQTVKVGEATKLSKNTFTNQGKTFAGWATSAQGPVVYVDEASVTDIVKDTTLYAVWTSNAEYTITYDANGGKGTMAAHTGAAISFGLVTVIAVAGLALIAIRRNRK